VIVGDALDKLRIEDDGLVCGDVRRWAETKYRLVSLYDGLFATGMKDKWDQRVYVDLYAGSGYGRIQGTSVVLKGSPILALTVQHAFDRYIFCEQDPALMAALQTRSVRTAPAADVRFVLGDCDSAVAEIVAQVPEPSTNNTVLSLCFVDPFDFGIKFETLRKLSSSFFVDFLVLLAIGMDANRNYDRYVDGDSTKIDEALGNTEWRRRWKDMGARRKEFRPFLASEFSKSMESLGYLGQELDQMKQVRSDEKNLPLYYLALFSKHETAYKFWRDVLKYGTDQSSFSWG
jgi:three-Cys-motif partner protein